MAEESEDNDDQVAEEMMRMMEEEGAEGDTAEAAGTEENDGEGAEATDEAGQDESSFDEEMLKAMQDEMASGDEGGGDAGDPLADQMIQAMATETGATPEAAATAVGALGGFPADISPDNLKRVLDIKLSVSIELGNTVENIETLLHWTEGSLIELDKVSGEPVDVLVNSKHYARGEVVVIAENFGVRIIDIQPVSVRRV